MKNRQILTLIPIFLAFFTMGFVDMVGTITNYVQKDFKLSETIANLLPSMIFLWFLVLSIPTGMLMNRIGRRKTVLLSLLVTAAALLVPSLSYIPFIGYNFTVMMVCFALLGIGNTLMQVSLNPLISNVVSGDKLASTLTFGQFIKAIASFLAPVLAPWALLTFGDWKLLFVIFGAVAVIAFIYLGLTPVKEQKIEGKASTFKECFALLGDPLILMLFFGILVHVGIDVGINLTSPKLLVERANMELEQALSAAQVYFVFRLTGCLLGSFILSKFVAKKIFFISVGLLLASSIGLFFSHTAMTIYICIAMIGLGNSNIFPMIFSRALLHKPSYGNEISGLMITGIAGGAVFPLFMGVANDAIGSQMGAVIVLTLCVLYLAVLAPKIK